MGNTCQTKPWWKAGEGPTVERFHSGRGMRGVLSHSSYSLYFMRIMDLDWRVGFHVLVNLETHDFNSTGWNQIRAHYPEQNWWDAELLVLLVFAQPAFVSTEKLTNLEVSLSPSFVCVNHHKMATPKWSNDSAGRHVIHPRSIRLFRSLPWWCWHLSSPTPCDPPDKHHSTAVEDVMTSCSEVVVDLQSYWFQWRWCFVFHRFSQKDPETNLEIAGRCLLHHENTMKTPWKHHENTMKTPWKHPEVFPLWRALCRLWRGSPQFPRLGQVRDSGARKKDFVCRRWFWGHCWYYTYYYILWPGWWWLVAIFGIFPFILGISSSQLTNSYFSEGFKPPTRYILLNSEGPKPWQLWQYQQVMLSSQPKWWLPRHYSVFGTL